MKISYSHLAKAFAKSISIEDMSDKLFQLGHEHELDGEIFDIEFTPNRGDCLSLLGLSRDLGIFYEKKENFISIFDGPIKPLSINFLNEAEEDCPKISFLNIEIDGDIANYKDYLESYFSDLNVTKNNFFTDISNYVSYEMGQPTHCYDSEKIKDDLVLTTNKEETKFNAITGQEIILSKGELVFTSDRNIINLAGVMGGKNTACSENTKNVLIECAYFKPEAIIGKSLKYNLNSDAAYKFERGTDISCHEKVLRRFIKIVSEHTNIKKIEIFCFFSGAKESTQIEFSPKKINNILGMDISSSSYKDYLNRLGFIVNKTITKPTYRNDIQTQNDLAEEIARTVGYNNIPINEFKIDNNIKLSKQKSKEESIKQFLVNNGFVEVINSSFSDDKNPKSIKVDNPIDKNRRKIRTSIINSLLANVIYNENRQKDSIKIFEISDVYSFEKEIKKTKVLAIMITGRLGHNYKDFNKKLDLKYLAGLLENICENSRSLVQEIGREGTNSKIRTPIFAIEIPLENLHDDILNYKLDIKKNDEFIKYQPISEYPSSFRDLSISIKNFEIVNELINSLHNYNSNILKESFMFDFFENKKNNEIKIGYRFIFQSQSTTLTENDIDIEVNKILEIINSFDNVEIPGLTD